MIDNVLRPMFIEGQAGMHTLLVFFSIMGGIAYMGMIGMIFGPIVVSLGLTFIELYKMEFQEELSKQVR
jgi:predicted PurR-regulated permease PerM